MTTATDPFGGIDHAVTPPPGDTTNSLGAPGANQRSIFGDNTMAPPSVITPVNNTYVAPDWLSDTLLKEAIMGGVATAAMSRQSIPWKPWDPQSRADAAAVRQDLHQHSVREGFRNDGIAGARNAMSNNGVSGVRPNQLGSEMNSAYRNLMNPSQFNLTNQAQTVLAAANYDDIAGGMTKSAASAIDDTSAVVRDGLDKHVTALADKLVDGTPQTTAYNPFNPSSNTANLVGDDALKSAANGQAHVIQREAAESLTDNVAKHAASYAADGFDPRHVASTMMDDHLPDGAVKKMGTEVGDDLSHKLTQELIGRGIDPHAAEAAAKQVGEIVGRGAGFPAASTIGKDAAEHALVQRALTNLTPESRLAAAADREAAEKAVREGADNAAREGAENAGERATREGAARAGKEGAEDAARSGVRHAVGSRLATASLGDRRVGKAATWATNRIGSRMERQALARAERSALRKALIHEAATQGAKLGILNAARIGALSIPVAGWAVSAALTVLFWAFDPGERKLIKGPIEWAFSGSHTPAFDAGPEWGRTQYLPLTNDGNRDPIIVAKDTPMVTLMRDNFGVDESIDRAHELWNPGSPANMGFGDLNAFLKTGEDLAQKIGQAQQALALIQRKYEDEQIIESAFNASLAVGAKGLSQLAEAVLPTLTNGMGSGSAAMQNVWARFVDENSKSRKAITESTGSLQWNPLRLFVNEVDEGSMGDMARVLLDTDRKLTDAATAVNSAVNGWRLNTKTSAVDPRGNQQTPPNTTKPDVPTLVPNSPTTVVPNNTPAPDNTTTNGNKDNLNKTIADILGSNQRQQPSTPTLSDPNQLAAQQAAQQAAQMAAQLAQQGVNAAMQPINQLAQQLRNPGIQQPAAFQQQPRPNAVPTTPQKATPAAPSGRSTPSQPVMNRKDDSDGAKKDAPAAKTPAPATPVRDAPRPDPKPDGDNRPDGRNDGDNRPAASNVVRVGDHDVRLPSEKHAAMLKSLMSSDGAQHPSVREAATRAGFHLPPDSQDIGQRVPGPAKLQPGDLVIGDRQQGIYTGDGRVYTSDGKEIPLSKISTGGAHQGLFHLSDNGSPSGNDHGGNNRGGSDDRVTPAGKSTPAPDTGGANRSGRGGTPPTGL